MLKIQFHFAFCPFYFLDKILNSSLPFGLAALKFCLPLARLSYFFFYYLVGRQLAWALVHWASDNEKLRAQQENLLVLHVDY